MQNKSNVKNRDDLKLIISAMALTLSLALWNLFSDGAPKPVEVNNAGSSMPTPMMQGKILLGGPAPKTTIIITQSNDAQPRNQQGRPQPVTNTSSSK